MHADLAVPQRSRRFPSVASAKPSLLWILVAIPILAIPLENQLEIASLSLAKLTILPLLVAVLIFRRAEWFRAVRSPIFLAALAFLAWAALVELLHPSPSWDFHYRTLQTVVFASLIAATLSHKDDYSRTLTAVVIVCSLLALYLLVNFYSAVNIETSDFKAAGTARKLAFNEMALAANLNTLAYTVGLGAVIALARLLSVKRTAARIWWGGVCLLCAVGAVVPLSRGAFVAVIASSSIVMWRGLKRKITPGKVLALIAVAMLLFALKPEALTGRLSLLKKESEVAQEQDARFRVYAAAIKAIPEYWALGIGAGNYWAGWGRERGLGKATPFGIAVIGPHNSFLAAWIYFGLPGLGLLAFVWYLTYRHRPQTSGSSWEALAINGLFLFLGVWLLFTHSIYLKEIGLILGLQIGASLAPQQFRERTMGLRRLVVPRRTNQLNDAGAIAYRRAKGASRSPV